jgi:hypothetical protein
LLERLAMHVSARTSRISFPTENINSRGLKRDSYFLPLRVKSVILNTESCPVNPWLQTDSYLRSKYDAVKP